MGPSKRTASGESRRDTGLTVAMLCVQELLDFGSPAMVYDLPL